MREDETVRALREALKVSPDNGPLRKHLARTLLGLELYDEAEAEYRAALRAGPDDPEALGGLATVYERQGKLSAGLVVLEGLMRQEHAPADLRVQYARLLARSGDAAEAVRQYKKAVAADPAAADAELAERLGVRLEAPRQEETPDFLLDGRERMGMSHDEAADDLDINLLVERPQITFADVGGMDAIQDEIRMKILLPRQNQELFAAYGKKAGGGMLLYGPPGCGKTHLARATAGEMGASFLSVGLHEVLDMWIGSSEKRLHDLFEHARNHAPSVLFFDEVDALAASRSDMRQSGGRHLINQFLAELDGVESSNEGVLVLAATNALWHVDGAFRRPGRFDSLIFVPPPDAEARAAILKIHLAGKPAETVDALAVAKQAKDFSGADLMAVVETAVEGKLKEALKSGTIQPLTTKDLQRAVKQRRASTSEWFATARNHALFANEGGLYDEVLAYMKATKRL